MSNIKKWIIIFIIILIIILGILLYSVYQNRGEIIYGIDEEGSELIYDLDETIQKVTMKNNFYIVKDCVNKFFLYYTAIFDTEEIYKVVGIEEIQKYRKINEQAIYELLDKEYINEKNVTDENISSKLDKKIKSTVNITNMYVSEKTNNISVYIVKGLLKESSTGNITDFQIMVKLDSINRTFSIIPQDYINEKYNNLEIGNNLEIEVPENIEENTHNTYSFNAILDEKYVKDLFSQFKTELLNYSKLFYNRLDENYREKRFRTYEEFQKYIQNNKEKYSTIQLNKYQKTVTDDYTQYVCIDQNNNYYIFRENAVFDYSLLLDTYTIDIPEFVEKYNKSSIQEKAQLNIVKFITGINDKNYNYVYGILAESFKQNKYPNIQTFRKFIQENFYENNDIQYKEFTQQGSNYIYKIKLTNKDSNEEKDMTIVMKLHEGTEFEMSFTME